jgi:hypothetical protein
VPTQWTDLVDPTEQEIARAVPISVPPEAMAVLTEPRDDDHAPVEEVHGDGSCSR